MNIKLFSGCLIVVTLLLGAISSGQASTPILNRKSTPAELGGW